MSEFCFLGVNGSIQELHGGNTSLLIRGIEGCLCADLSCNLAAVIEAEPDVVVLTHEHIDHVYGLPSFLHQSWLKGRKKPLKILVPTRMEAIPEEMIGLFRLREKKGIFDITVSDEKVLYVGSLRVETFVTDHTQTSIGLIVEEGEKRLVFTSDTKPGLSLPRADVLIHEASGLSIEEETLVKKGHSSGVDAGMAARETGAGKLYLCHLPEEGKYKVLKDAQRAFPQTEIPKLLKWYRV
ncbi:MAG: MBL fold metallo-hydrolase [Oscillospiraceae bacterium]|nr:MBL fold metallo-hydrolase [Oscillospiraceae bacterium]